MKIYSIYSKLSTLEPNGGDKINEIGTLLALSKFADVYYAGQKFDPILPSYGLKKQPITVTPGCDLYMIRANKSVFDSIRKRKKALLASPYDHDRFEKSNILTTLSHAWALSLRNGETIPTLNPSGKKWPRVYSLNQTILPHFKPISDHQLKARLLEKYNCKHLVGYFGRIVKSNYPGVLFRNLDYITKQLPGVKFLFATKNSNMLPLHGSIISTSFHNDSIPAIMSCCDAVLVTQHGPEWDYCGNLKVIEPMACGVPVICERSLAREEQLGIDYNFFLERGTLANNLVFLFAKKLIEAIKEGSGQRDYLLNRASSFSIDASAAYLKELFSKIL